MARRGHRPGVRAGAGAIDRVQPPGAPMGLRAGDLIVSGAARRITFDSGERASPGWPSGHFLAWRRRPARALTAFSPFERWRGQQILGARLGANGRSIQATPSYRKPSSMQFNALSSDIRRHPAMAQRCLLSSGSRVRILPGARPCSGAAELAEETLALVLQVASTESPTNGPTPGSPGRSPGPQATFWPDAPSGRPTSNLEPRSA
jgi:hypothetical protein